MQGFSQLSFEEAVQQALEKFDSSKTFDDMKDAAAMFERIAGAEPERWQPHYYVSFINCLLAFKTNDPVQIKQYASYAQENLAIALKIAPEESELHTLQGMVYQAMLLIDPVNNAMEYSAKANASFETAMRLNPANPRPLYLQALSLMHTPEQFGGGRKAALPLFEKANGLFEAFLPENNIAPNWGKHDCSARLADCKEVLK
ncbi:MAG: hypothetical protein JXB34_14220 [Bacteroidales bacterium]|nr:hypothetical protein [Bacteroidales bacterium]